MTHRCGIILVVLGACVLAGCRGPSETYATASGTVRIDGEPLSGAIVTLEPIGVTRGPNASVAVFQGRFAIPAEAKLHGGTYRVRIAMMPAELLATLRQEHSVSLPAEGLAIAQEFDGNSSLRCELVPSRSVELSFDVRFAPSRQ